jgi:hypothetical protein
VNLADLHQGQTEQVVSFYPRVIKAVDDLEALAGAAFPLPDPPFPVEFTNVAGFAALAVPVRAAAAQSLVTFGAVSAFNHIALNLFVSNLRPSLRDELLKSPPATLYGAFEAASQLERLQETPKRPTAAAMAVEGAPSSSPATVVPADTDASADGNRAPDLLAPPLLATPTSNVATARSWVTANTSATLAALLGLPWSPLTGLLTNRLLNRLAFIRS